MQRNKNVFPKHKGTKIIKQKLSGGAQMLAVIDKAFESSILSVFKELKETVSKQLKESMRTMSQQMYNVKIKYTNYEKKTKILEMRSIMTERKISLKLLNSRFEQASMNLKEVQGKFESIQLEG